VLLAVVGIQYPSIIELVYKILVRAVYSPRTSLLGSIRGHGSYRRNSKAAGFRSHGVAYFSENLYLFQTRRPVYLQRARYLDWSSRRILSCAPDRRESRRGNNLFIACVGIERFAKSKLKMFNCSCAGPRKFYRWSRAKSKTWRAFHFATRLDESTQSRDTNSRQHESRVPRSICSLRLSKVGRIIMS